MKTYIRILIFWFVVVSSCVLLGAFFEGCSKEWRDKVKEPPRFDVTKEDTKGLTVYTVKDNKTGDEWIVLGNSALKRETK